MEFIENEVFEFIIKKYQLNIKHEISVIADEAEKLKLNKKITRIS